jgi:hypothetical protein
MIVLITAIVHRSNKEYLILQIPLQQPHSSLHLFFLYFNAAIITALLTAQHPSDLSVASATAASNHKTPPLRPYRDTQQPPL